MTRPKHPVNAATARLLAAGYSIDRQSAVLSLLNLFHVMTKAQLESFLFGDSVDPQTREVITRRILLGLLEQQLISRFRFDGKDVWCIRLPKGNGLVPHDLKVVDVVETFLATARRDDDVLSHAETRLKVGGTAPDAYVVYERGDTEYSFFIELEMGTSSGPRFREKVDRYLSVYRSKQWQEPLDQWPYILFVSGDEAFERRLLRSAVDTELELRLSNLPLLEELGPFGTVWTKPGSEQRGAL